MLAFDHLYDSLMCFGKTRHGGPNMWRVYLQEIEIEVYKFCPANLEFEHKSFTIIFINKC
jgi:hypothetical protein